MTVAARRLARILTPAGATVTRRLVVAATAVAVLVGSVVTVVLVTDRPRAERGPLAGAGEAFDVDLDPLKAMKRPKAGDGVKLKDAEEAASGEVRRPGAKSKKACEKPSASGAGAGDEADGASPLDLLLATDGGTEVCVYSETRQADEVPDADPLTIAEGYEPAPAPRSPPGDATDEPSDQPTDEPSDQPTDEPSDQPTDEPSGDAVDPPDQEGAGGQPPGRVRQAAFTGTPRAAAAPDPGEYLSPNWVELAPSSQPDASTEAVMAYDVTRDQVVRFGGRNSAGTALAQTWVWNGIDWVQKTPATSPPVRYRASMAWDATLGTLVLFGGQSSASGWLGDVWAWDGTTWAQLTPTGTAPTARAGAMMAYDTARGGLVIFGGTNASGARNDTWQLKANAWTQVQAHGASGAPAARFDGGLAYSASTNQLVLFGGASTCGSGTCTTLDDTWVLGPAASAWTAQSPDHEPPARSSMAMTLDAGLGVVPPGTGVDPSQGAVVLFGGISYDGTTPVLHNDTWAWTGDDWARAVGIASPSGRAGMSMASDDSGQMVLFGGIGGAGATFLDETWAYDATLPVLEVNVTGASGGTEEEPVFWTGDVAEITITAHNAGSSAISDVTLTSALQSTLLAVGSIFKLDDTALPVCSGIVTVLCGGVSDLTASITRIDIPVGATRVGDFLAAVVGTQRGCDLIDIPAIASDLLGASPEVYAQITVCGGGLGKEDWWTYDTTDLGGGGSASVNVANGNLVVQHTDTTPVQAPGRLALGIGRVYNSQDHFSDSMNDPLGIGWQFDLGETGGFAGGFGIGGLPVLPNIQTVLQPLSMPYIDRDGTRHTFKLRSVGATIGDVDLPIDLTGSGGGIVQQILRLLNPQTLLFPLTSTVLGQKYDKLCIDQAYTGPPGSNMYLFRYIGTAASGCANPASDGFVQVGWSLVRPDRVRYDYDILGRIISVTDPAGQQIRYEYNLDETHGPTRIYTKSCGRVGACPYLEIDYATTGQPIGRRVVTVTDSAGRVTSYLVRVDGFTPYLEEVWEPGNPLPPPGSASPARPSWSYTYSTSVAPCPGSDDDAKTVGQLCSATDALGNTTTFSYIPAPIGPDRVLEVTDRRGNDTDSGTGDGDGGSKGLATRYTWTDHSTDHDAPPVQVNADMGAPDQVAACSTGADTGCQRVRYTGIDDWGRVGQIAEGDSGGSYLRQTGYFWDGLGESGGIESCTVPLNAAMNHNLCQTIRKAKPTNDPLPPGQAGTATVDGVTAHDEAIAYTYGTLGQTLRQKVLLDASQSWTDANSAITTWGSHDQYFDANGDQRVFTNHVRGNGQVGSSAVGAQYVAAVDADAPYAYWRLGETSGGGGTTMTARTGPNGVYQSGVTLGAPGVIGDNAAINESTTGNGALVSPLNGFANGTGTSSSFTVEAWQKTTDTTQPQRTFAWGNALAYAEVGRNYGGRPIIYLSSDVAANDTAAIVGANSIADGEWHHVVYTYDGTGTAAGLAIWVDGVQQPVTVVADTLDGAFAASSTTGSTGRGGPGSSLDELTLYTKVLTPGRIKAHFQSGFGGDPVEADTLYAVTDQTQELSPRGNAPGNASHWGDYLTTIRRDLPPNGTLASTNKPGDDTICGTATRGNTGLVCEIDTPSSAGVPAGACQSPTASMPAGSPAAPTSGGYTHACTTYEYNDAGQRTLMRSPKANAANRPETTEYRYYADTDTCAGGARNDCDLSGTVSAGGWLKAVIDTDGKRTIFAYDAAGNVARTWERNATAGLPLNGAWANAATPPSAAYTDQVNATPVTSDSLSVSNTALVTVGPDGTIWGSGTNASGELGDGTTTPESEAVRAVGMGNVVQVAQSSTGALSGCSRTFYLTGSGEVWWAGPGQAIPAPVDPDPTPADPDPSVLKDIIQIAAGGCHALALDAQGRVWAWGSNVSGQIGKGSTGGAWVDTPVEVLDKVSTIGAGYLHSLAVRIDGTLWTWGDNATGQLGLGDTILRDAPTQVSAMGPGSIGGVRAVSGGVGASYALTRDGKAWSWGANSTGDLGLGDTTQRTTPTRITTLGDGTTAGPVRQIIGASGGAAALMADGTVRAWGVNSSGQLGGGASGTSTSPVAVPGLTGQVALGGGWATWASADAAGKVTVWGSTANRQRADGTNPTSTTTPVTAGLDISPYRLPGWTLRGTRDATGNLTTQTADPLGQVRRIRSGRGNEVLTAAFDTTAGYDAAGRPTWSAGAQHRSTSTIATVSYDPYGNPVRTIDARGVASRASFDDVNRQLTAEVTRGPVDPGNTELNDSCPGTATAGAWTPGQEGHQICTTSTTYDGVDRQITTTDGASQTTRTWFDGAGRQIRLDVPRSEGVTLTGRWNYDVDGNMVDYCTPREFDTGNESAASGTCTSTGKLSTHYTVDRAGRTISEKRYRGSTELVTAYRYDADGNAIGVTDANDHETTTAYDFQGRRTSRTVPRSASASTTTRWTYDDSGNVTAINTPGFLNTGTGADGDLVVDGATNGVGNPFQVPLGAQYRNVTLTNGAHVTTTGTSKGLVFSVTGTLTVCATCAMTMAGKGDTGGIFNQDAANPNPGHGGKKGSSSVTGTGGGAAVTGRTDSPAVVSVALSACLAWRRAPRTSPGSAPTISRAPAGAVAAVAAACSAWAAPAATVVAMSGSPLTRSSSTARSRLPAPTEPRRPA
ncbi:Kelch repeat-containing protein [Nocardioides humi]|uniref:RCC1 domain-containing protein n=1 Tax=Nocardioides humi TaxID=449461 RepID=UPI0015E8658F|nr:LamG-like jellyroll fold domain-containing protein [Nocardioides humi]